MHFYYYFTWCKTIISKLCVLKITSNMYADIHIITVKYHSFFIISCFNKNPHTQNVLRHSCG